jgi:hypothetical protein
MSDAKVLLKDGDWQVPPEERPCGWEKIPVKSQAKPAAPPIALEAIAEATDAIVEQVAAEAAGQVQGPLCGCGQPANHVQMCRVRAKKAAATRARRLELFRELSRAVHESAAGVGAEKSLVMAAHVMVAGMWTRDLDQLRRLTGYDAHFVKAVAERLAASIIWRHPRLVRLGEIDDRELGDLPFWLNAMVADGTLYVEGDGDTYGLAEWRKKR